MMKRKGVSTYISVLLLIVVTIAGGVMIYGYTIGWFGRDYGDAYNGGVYRNCGDRCDGFDFGDHLSG